MAKRGRPKSTRPLIDTGTPELVAKRAFLVGAADPAYAEHPLGILFVRGTSRTIMNSRGVCMSPGWSSACYGGASSNRLSRRA